MPGLGINDCKTVMGRKGFKTISVTVIKDHQINLNQSLHYKEKSSTSGVGFKQLLNYAGLADSNSAQELTI